jgi:hypothetical protein
MPYKIILLFLLLFITNCTEMNKKSISINKDNNIINFTNTGFALIYTDDFFNEKIIFDKLDNRSLTIFQKNLKKGSHVRIRNVLNNKTLIAKVIGKSIYPEFNNSVITSRIASELDLDIKEPYIEIFEILQNSTFLSKKTTTFDEEKNVANKAPVESIKIKNLNDENKVKKKEIIIKKFNYTIKVADFYFRDSANLMLMRIKKETSIKKVTIQSLSSTKYRVMMGPFTNLNSLKKAFNDINVLNFENIEIIRNEKTI